MEVLRQQFILLVTTNLNTKVLVGAFLTVVSFFFDALLAKVFLILLVLILIDCILGYIRAVLDKRAIVSKLMRNYAWRFVGYSIAISTLFMVSHGSPNIPIVTGLLVYLDDIALAFFIVQEATSILEHLNELGIPMPQKVFANLRKVKEQFDEVKGKDIADQYNKKIN